MIQEMLNEQKSTCTTVFNSVCLSIAFTAALIFILMMDNNTVM